MTDVVDKAGLACESVLPFKIESSVVNAYKERTPPFGFNGLGELVYRRTYARELQNGEQGSEQWYQTVERVVNGTYNMQKRWILSNDLDWDDERAQNSAKNMYGLIFDMKFLPPGRGLWAMGSPITEERQLYAAVKGILPLTQLPVSCSAVLFGEHGVSAGKRPHFTCGVAGVR